VEQILDGSLAVAVNAMRALCGAEWTPSEVRLSRGAPTDQEPYRRQFRAPVRFNEEVAALVFPTRDLERRIDGADALLRAVLEEQIMKLKGPPQSAFSDDIRRLLRARITSNHCSAADVAELLMMHRRTLSRRLKGSGVGYRAIANPTPAKSADQPSSGARMKPTVRRGDLGMFGHGNHLQRVDEPSKPGVRPSARGRDGAERIPRQLQRHLCCRDAEASAVLSDQPARQRAEEVIFREQCQREGEARDGDADPPRKPALRERGVDDAGCVAGLRDEQVTRLEEAIKARALEERVPGPRRHHEVLLIQCTDGKALRHLV